MGWFVSLIKQFFHWIDRILFPCSDAEAYKQGYEAGKRARKRWKVKFFLLLAICLCVSGCDDTHLSQPMEMVFFGGETVEVPETTISGVPADLQTLLWGDRDVLMQQLLDLGEGDAVAASALLDQICLIDAHRKHYTKYIDAGRIAVLGGQHIHDSYFYAAEVFVKAITAKRPELREVLSPQHGFRIVFYNAGRWGPSDIPEVDSADIAGWTGLGWCAYDDNYCAAPAWGKPEDADEAPDHFSLSTFVHEFGHAVHRAINTLDPTFQARLESAFAQALETGGVYGAGTYSMTNVREYWAEGVVFWFYKGAAHDIWHNDLIEKDPLLYALLDEWFPVVDLGEIVVEQGGRN